MFKKVIFPIVVLFEDFTFQLIKWLLFSIAGPFGFNSYLALESSYKFVRYATPYSISFQPVTNLKIDVDSGVKSNMRRFL